MRSPRRDPMSLPYLIRTLSCGRQVLLDREYKAIFLRKPGAGTVTKCNGQKSMAYVRSDYLHCGGRVSHTLYKILLQVERDFCAGRELQVEFWKPDTVSSKRATIKPVCGPNVVRFPGAVPQFEKE